MSQGGLFSRLRNLVRGAFGSWIGRQQEQNPEAVDKSNNINPVTQGAGPPIAERDPEAVYESAIQWRLEQCSRLKEMKAKINDLRNKLDSELEQKGKALKTIQEQIEQSVGKEEDEVALVLIEKKNELEAELTRINEVLKQAARIEEKAKRSLLEFQGEIERLRREKERAMAQPMTVEARRGIMRQLDHLSLGGDIRALEFENERLERHFAEIEAGKKLLDRTLNEKPEPSHRESSLSTAKAQLEELKKARQAKAEAVKVEKTI